MAISEQKNIIPTSLFPVRKGSIMATESLIGFVLFALVFGAMGVYAKKHEGRDVRKKPPRQTE